MEVTKRMYDASVALGTDIPNNDKIWPAFYLFPVAVTAAVRHVRLVWVAIYGRQWNCLSTGRLLTHWATDIQFQW